MNENGKEVVRKYFEENKEETKLDIGSAEGTYGSEDGSWLRIDINEAEESMGGKVDLIVDAHDMSCFEDESFDEIWSGACLVCYTRDEAVKEAVRVLKKEGKMEVRIQMSYLGRLIRCLYENSMYVEGIEELNYGAILEGEKCIGDELIEVIVTAKKGESDLKGVSDEPHIYEE